jgi:hypothetical protein
MVEITITLPDMLAHTFGATPEARSQRLAEDAAIEEYRVGRLSHRQKVISQYLVAKESL